MRFLPERKSAWNAQKKPEPSLGSRLYVLIALCRVFLSKRWKGDKRKSHVKRDCRM
jgi:hypothetical protein